MSIDVLRGNYYADKIVDHDLQLRIDAWSNATERRSFFKNIGMPTSNAEGLGTDLTDGYRNALGEMAVI